MTMGTKSLEMSSALSEGRKKSGVNPMVSLSSKKESFEFSI
jgi:hypothetical protein